ncbi:Uncharacterised protein [Mycobacteroides abscessus subsp. abscessus]|nr:Uncharacterised protein [Mycobacteroides abscessus subsp. abscessus]
MSSPRRIARLYSAANSHEVPPAHQLNARARRTRTAPPPDVMAAVEFLLAEPDAYLYRRRYLPPSPTTPPPKNTSSPPTDAEEQYNVRPTFTQCRQENPETTRPGRRNSRPHQAAN